MNEGDTNSFIIEKMSQKDALEIANNWKYPAPYDFYDMTADREDYEEIIDSNQRGDYYFTLTKNGNLIGFFCIYPYEETEGEFEYGVGLRPDLTGKGLGTEYNRIMLDYVKKTFKPKKIWLAVADFNQRALAVYERVGFNFESQKKQATNGSIYSFTVMSLSIRK